MIGCGQNENEFVAEHAGRVGVHVIDTSGIVLPRWSPGADRIAYTHRFGLARPPAIVIVDKAGLRVQSLQLPADSGERGPATELARRPARLHRGHVNPSTTMYLEWDTTTGQLVSKKAGLWFAVSPDGRFVAQRAHCPTGLRRPMTARYSW